MDRSLVFRELLPSKAVSKVCFLSPNGGFLDFLQAIVFLLFSVFPTSYCDQSLAKTDCHQIPHVFMYHHSLTSKLS